MSVLRHAREAISDNKTGRPRKGRPALHSDCRSDALQLSDQYQLTPNMNGIWRDIGELSGCEADHTRFEEHLRAPPTDRRATTSVPSQLALPSSVSPTRTLIGERFRPDTPRASSASEDSLYIDVRTAADSVERECGRHAEQVMSPRQCQLEIGVEVHDVRICLIVRVECILAGPGPVDSQRARRGDCRDPASRSAPGPSGPDCSG